MPLHVDAFSDDAVVRHIVELSQAPEYEPQRRQSCAWKAGKLITTGAWVLFVIAMVVWLGWGWGGGGWW